MLCSIKSCPHTVTNVCKYCHCDLCDLHKSCPKCQEESIRFMNKLHKYRTEYPYSSLLLEEHVFSDMTMPDMVCYALYAFWVIYIFYCMIHFSQLADSLIASAMGIIATKLLTFVTGELMQLKLTSFEDYLDSI